MTFPFHSISYLFRNKLLACFAFSIQHSALSLFSFFLFPFFLVNAQVRKPAASEYNVIALRVEFQPDTTRFTTGDGTFNDKIWKGLKAKIDPLPHDAGYFQAHLDFLGDYVKRASDGKTQLKTHLVPQIIRLSKQMGAYSPTGTTPDSDTERAKLTAMIREAWATANVQATLNTSGFDPNKTAFLLFHAGAGRDLELVGTPLDKTPEDLPSLFFSAKDLQGITFKGLPVNTTAVLPETETRVGYNFITKENFLQELSINGLLAASFFNFMGVPDLFNTATNEGQTAIGAFCLMDFEGFFAYRGLLPPEPSAWVKYYLGWIEPTRLTNAASAANRLRAAATLGSSDAFLVPISPSEFLLVENRHRDPESDGLNLRIWQNGSIVTQKITNQDAKFTRLNPESFSGGVIVGADSYDWALPGGLETTTAKTERNGGILIWHIDEKVISENLATNKVNGNSKRRGVSLIEAGTAQDIGFAGHSCDAKTDENIFSGTVDDYWYKSNPQNCALDADRKSLGRYNNFLSPLTSPSTNAHNGGFSGIYLENFSDAGASMTFDYRRENGKEAILLTNPMKIPKTSLSATIPLKGKDRNGALELKWDVSQSTLTWLLPQNRTVTISLTNYASSGALNRFPVLADVDNDGLLDAVCIFGTNLLAFNQNGALIEPFPIKLTATSEAQPLIAKFANAKNWSIFVASTDGSVYAYDWDTRGALHTEFPLNVGKKILSTPLLFDKTLYAVSEEGDLRAWQLPNVTEIWWGELYQNNENQSYVELNKPAPTPSATELLIQKETYNYPNPIKDGFTNLRFACSAACEVRITIADLAGGLIKDFPLILLKDAMPQEMKWDTQNVASGVYLARISATANGKTESKLVKMAVIK